tara:strand:- start:235 stop:639 length:405 start_codon:yes stop_codon:yes gene_type:complete
MREVFTKLKVLKTKHILCKVWVNGKKAKFLIDTGASNSCIHSDLQDYFELQKYGEPFQASGASEGKMEAVMTLNCNIKLGRNYKGKQAFVLLDLSHVNGTLRTHGVEEIDGVIGADFLKENKAIIDYGQSKLFL